MLHFPSLLVKLKNNFFLVLWPQAHPQKGIMTLPVHLQSIFSVNNNLCIFVTQKRLYVKLQANHVKLPFL